MKKNLSQFLLELRSSQRADPNVPVYTHGEKEILSYNDKIKNGIPVNISTVAEMINLCKFVGMDHTQYLGDVDVSGAKQSIYDNLYK